MEFTPEQQTEIDKMIEAAKQGLLTQEDLDKAAQSSADKVRTECSKKLKDLEDATTAKETELSAKTAELWKKQIAVTLAEKGLAEFTPLFDGVVDDKDLQAKIDALTKAMEQKGASNLPPFIPGQHQSQSAYTQAQVAKNPEGMIAAKLSKLIGG